ncbi:MAG TPA: cation transporter [Candidatus Hypogeohydataceae bacterium YC41]
METVHCSGQSCSLPSFIQEEQESIHMEIAGITSRSCAKAIKTALIKLPEVKGVDVNWKKGTANIKIEKGLDSLALVEAVEGAGFNVASTRRT